jgi:glycosyltransferase involved in cell wall biosynthesis
MSNPPLFTVFTPTHNRAHTIQRVFSSLSSQTLRDFEWLVVDDGSTDNTSELIAAWTKFADFPIRCFKQDHSGKHFAHNLALREAKGEFFMLLDSDDACVPQALERIAYHWNTIPAGHRVHFSSVTGLCMNQHGNIVGDRFPFDPFDVNLRDQRYVYKLRGEKGGASRTEVLRQFPFPEIRGTQFVPEGAVWLEIAKKYKRRCVNEVFRIYYVDDDQTGATLTKTKRLDQNAPGWLYYYVWLLNNDLSYFFFSPPQFLKAAVMLPIVSWFSGQTFRQTLKSLRNFSAKALVCSAISFSILLYLFDRIGSKKSGARGES